MSRSPYVVIWLHEENIACIKDRGDNEVYRGRRSSCTSICKKLNKAFLDGWAAACTAHASIAVTKAIQSVKDMDKLIRDTVPAGAD